MPVERMVANSAVPDDAGKVALQRGPVVYCLEQCDHKVDVMSVSLPDKARLTARRDDRLLGGCVVLEGVAVAADPAGWKGKLYRSTREAKAKAVKIKVIPYSLWCNREPGAMTVWMPRQ
jgi:DUF1680 family protein